MSSSFKSFTSLPKCLKSRRVLQGGWVGEERQGGEGEEEEEVEEEEEEEEEVREAKAPGLGVCKHYRLSNMCVKQMAKTSKQLLIAQRSRSQL